MNKKIYLLILIAFVGILSGMYAVYSYNTLKVKTQDDNKKVSASPTPKKENTEQSIIELITSGKNLECTFDSTLNGVKTIGTTYVSNRKLKGEFSTKINEKSIKNYILSDGTYFYSWNDDSKQGIKMKIDTLNSDIKSQQLESFKKFSDKYEYTCKPWNNADNAFDAPGNVKFSDFSQVSTTPNENINMCAGCDFITDETAKKECKQQFNCK